MLLLEQDTIRKGQVYKNIIAMAQLISAMATRGTHKQVVINNA